MSIPAFEIRHHYLHVLDGTGTPNGMAVIQLNDIPDIPVVTPRPSTGRQLDSGKFNANVVTFVEDEGVPFDPVQMTLSLTMLPEQWTMFDALCNPFNRSPWAVGAQTWAPVTSIGQRYDSSGTLQNCQLPADVWQRNRMVNLVSEERVNATQAPTGTPIIIQVAGVVLESLTLTSNNVLRTGNFTFQVYGGITRLTAVPSYTANTPAPG